MPIKKTRSHNKISIFLYVLFAAAFFGWTYFDAVFDACVSSNIANNILNSELNQCLVYKDMSSFCFLVWIVALIMLVIFTINSVITKGIKALKLPALFLLATVVLYFISGYVLKLFLQK